MATEWEHWENGSVVPLFSLSVRSIAFDCHPPIAAAIIRDGQ